MQADSSQAIAPLVMEEVFTTGGQKEVGIIFGSIIGPDYKNECFTANQVRDVVRKYVTDNNLEQVTRHGRESPSLCLALSGFIALPIRTEQSS